MMNLSTVLRQLWYPKFLPKTPVNSFKIGGWKVMVLNSDSVPGKPLMCKRAGDEKVDFFSFKDLEKNFLPQRFFAAFIMREGYQVLGNDNGVLKIVPLKSDS